MALTKENILSHPKEGPLLKLYRMDAMILILVILLTCHKLDQSELQRSENFPALLNILVSEEKTKLVTQLFKKTSGSF